MYSLDKEPGYVEDCPRCKHSLERLAKYNAICRNEGYSLDYSTDSDDAWTFLFFGRSVLILRKFVRELLIPLMHKVTGERRQSRLDAVLKVYPRSLICPHCKHVVRLK